MNWIETKNLQAVALADIPRVSIEELMQQTTEAIGRGLRPIQFFGRKTARGVTLYMILGDDEQSTLYIASAPDVKGGFPSLTPEVPSLHLFEREIYEQFGLEPQGHPWLKPVRKGLAGIAADETPYPFFTMKGDEVHEVGVGPIHAGIIEPGHFRFLCTGETVHHLEIELGFQHRGVEALFLRQNNRPAYLLHLAESITGDSVIAHAGSYVRAMEAMHKCPAPHKAQAIRTIALELERIGIHLGDLAALAGDVAYLTGNATFGALRTKIINTTLAICGSRFGRGFLTVGGVNHDISATLKKEILDTLQQVEEQAALAAEVMFDSSSVTARFEKTGIVTKEQAQDIGLVGPAARASGIAIDVRADYPYESYLGAAVHKLTHGGGDVMARAHNRSLEISQSFSIIYEQLSHLKSGRLTEQPTQHGRSMLVVSMTEGWRGQVVHTTITGRDGLVQRYKITDPSFYNWFGLALAVRDNGISDFPVCNKSFNLSYCGFDL